ncbi:EpsG family protein [Gammaproteobacteria bacterium]|nr:EpsG family protein [Gammaproteobacteria bacterium]
MPATLAFFGKRKNISSNKFPAIDPLWFITILVLTLLIGLRFEVGGDWHSYIELFEKDQMKSLFYFGADPGYVLLNKISGFFGLGIYGVNFLAGFIFSIGLSIFCNNLPRPLLALTVSIPYLVIVVSMGYSRQALALGIAMIALVAISKQKNFWFIFLILTATTVHKSAFVLLPIVGLASSRSKLLILFWTSLLGLLAYFLFLAASFETLIRNYIESEYESQGAFIRLAMLVLPAAIYLLWPHRFNLPDKERKIWKIFALLSLGFFLILPYSGASTAIDRLALYLLPLQLVIFSYLPDIFGKRGGLNQILTGLVIFYYALVLFIWLNFATHSKYWLPYLNLILM